jgi:hypothetical protein
LNNNRNNRRRGRGNRNQGGNGAQLNRIDSRARGNAPQMLDKYKKLAQDAQHNGDRVQMEYYLQFADHYFRVIADNKARQDEQRGGPRRTDDRDQAEDYGDDDLDFDRGRRSEQPTRSRYEPQDLSQRSEIEEGEPGQEGEPFLTADRDEPQGEAAGDLREERQPRQRRPRQPREAGREAGREGGREPAQGGERQERAERPAKKRPERAAEPTEAKPARARKPRKTGDDDGRGAIDSSILPPSIRGDGAGGENDGALETVD